MLWEGGGGQEAGPLLPRKLVLVLYSPLDTILPFHPFCPKSEHWGPVALTCLPSTPGTLEGRKGLEHSPDPPYVGPAVGVCDLPCPPTSSSTIPTFYFQTQRVRWGNPSASPPLATFGLIKTFLTPMLCKTEKNTPHPTPGGPRHNRSMGEGGVQVFTGLGGVTWQPDPQLLLLV